MVQLVPVELTRNLHPLRFCKENMFVGISHMYWFQVFLDGLPTDTNLCSINCFFLPIEILMQIVTFSFVLLFLMKIGKLACKLYEQMRREASAVRIQKNLRRYTARKSYLTVWSTAITLQTGLRAMTARNEFRFRKQTKAAILIQVPLLHLL